MAMYFAAKPPLTLKVGAPVDSDGCLIPSTSSASPVEMKNITFKAMSGESPLHWSDTKTFAASILEDICNIQFDQYTMELTATYETEED